MVGRPQHTGATDGLCGMWAPPPAPQALSRTAGCRVSWVCPACFWGLCPAGLSNQSPAGSPSPDQDPHRPRGGFWADEKEVTRESARPPCVRLSVGAGPALQLIPSLGRACCREPDRQRTPPPAESWDAPFLQPCPGFPEGRMGRIAPSRSPGCRNGGEEPAEALCDPLPHRAQGDCAARRGDRETRPHVTRCCPQAPRSRRKTRPEEVTIGADRSAGRTL